MVCHSFSILSFFPASLFDAARGWENLSWNRIIVSTKTLKNRISWIIIRGEKSVYVLQFAE